MKAMTIRESYATAIKNYEINAIPEMANIQTGYCTKSGRIYANYFSKESFEMFVGNMSGEHRKQYVDASGGELTEKKGRYGYYPPKMASFASSSRMIYLLSRSIDGFVFELNLSTGLGGPANLDGFQFHDNRYTFVEAKRLEIFDSHSPVREAYRYIYEIINSANTPFTIKCPDSIDGEFKPTFYCEAIEIHYFDIKQMISHMLGIAKAFIVGTSEYCDEIFTFQGNRSINFLYLLYNPSYLMNCNSSLTKLEQKKISERYNAVVEEINICTRHMAALFEVIFHYQFEKENVRCDIPHNKFSFKLVDQEQFKNEF